MAREHLLEPFPFISLLQAIPTHPHPTASTKKICRPAHNSTVGLSIFASCMGKH
jgi:hypothetical protein